jgi:hypothetical protein
MGLWDALKGGLSSLFGGGGQKVISSMGQGVANNSGFGGGGGGGGLGGLLKSGLGGLGSLFQSGGGSGNMLGGLGTIGLSQLISNPKSPAMPEGYNQYMQMMQGGGTPGMQSANQYYQGVLSGQNQGAYDAATSSLDDTYADEERKLISMYKTLRPGTDPSTDSTFKRDLSDLQGNYAKQRALAQAGVQQGAAAGAANVGSQQMQGLQSGLSAQLDQLASQWGMSYAQKDALRKMIMGVGGYQVTGPQNIFSKGITG